MELRVLRYFLAVARERSITHAAAALHITQPTLSRQIADLESELGVPLFRRDRKNLTLTEAGLRFVQRAEEILTLTEHAISEVSIHHKDICGEVTIGCAESPGFSLFADACQRVQKRNPGIRVCLQTANATCISEQLECGTVDFGFMLAPVKLSDYEHLRLPHVDTWGLLVRRDHPFAELAQLSPDQVASQPLITSYREPVLEFLSGWLGRQLSSCDIRCRYNLAYNAARFVEAGVGCAICLDGLVPTGGESLLRFIPFAPRLSSPSYLVWKKARFFSRAAQVFYLALCSEVRRRSSAQDAPARESSADDA